MAQLPLIFEGTRWPAAQALGRNTFAIVRTDGAIDPPQRFVTIHVPRGQKGRSWMPEPVDATWRDLADLDLADVQACVRFVQRRGDLYSGVASYVVGSPRYEISSASWAHLAGAMRHLAKTWDPPAPDGVSYPSTDPNRRREAPDFLKGEAVSSALRQVYVASTPSRTPLLALHAGSLAAFLVLRAAQALDHLRPMRRCIRCGAWFEIRRALREPQFCSGSCRALHHQQWRIAHGVRAEEPNEERINQVAGRMDGARPRRKVAPKDEEFQPGAGCSAPREPDGDGDRTKGRR